MAEEVKWTKEQKQAIYEKGENILVAAAAGSGKTAVLVERIIKKVIEEEIDIDKILVVTFTNAAASEMRQRILEAIYKKIEEDPINIRLQRQITLLNRASICTIHAFCLDIIRNNFYEIDTSANFRIGDTAEIELLKQEVMEEIFEEKYEQEDEKFINLINLYTKYRDDTSLKELIFKMYNFIQSMPFPEEWLEEKIEEFNIKNDNDFAQTNWGKVLINEVKENIEEGITRLITVKRKMQKWLPEMEKFYIAICRDIEMLEEAKEGFNNKNWDAIYQNLSNIKFERWPTDKKCEVEYKAEAKEIRDIVSKKIKENISEYFIYNNEQIKENLNYMYYVLKNMQELIISFSNRFAKVKKERNLIDFNDIEHFALKICVKKEYGKIVPTEAAKKIQQKFEEILIDEYQDSNDVQENILKSISKGNNIFMVGDVKQSIYKFRQAKPELFLQKYETYTKEKQVGNGVKIQLFKNFRSRESVLDITNLIFENIMKKDIGGIEYTKEEFLNLGADYKKPEEEINYAGNPELHIIDLKEDDDSDEIETEELVDNSQIEAKFVVSKIQELLNSDYKVYDRKLKKYRNVHNKDIVILLRSTSILAPVYEKELEEKGIAVFSDTSSEYLDSIEIQTIMSLLKIIDNPMQDIPLVTVLKSAIANFTDNELVQIRLVEKNENFFTAMLKARNSVEVNLANKINNFLENLEKWKKMLEYKTLDELIWQIYSDTNYYNYVGLLNNGKLKQANLKMLFEKAKQYEQASFKGLFQFINFIDKLKTNSGDMQSAKIIGENEDVVRIMSIHKSKGLEFPIVFLCATNKKFNMQDLNQKILLHEKLGIGPNYIGSELPIEYPTLAKEALKIQAKMETIAEEMRILYVALTRAKEKLFITGIDKDLQKSWKDKQALLDMYTTDTIPSNLIKKYTSYLDWIELVYCKNKGNIELIEHKVKELNIEEQKEEQNNILEKLEKINIDKVEQENIKEKLQFEYPYKESTILPTQLAVTDIKKSLLNVEQKIELTTPKFMLEENKLTQAQKGTLIHLCIQKMQENKIYSIQDIKDMINHLVKDKIILKNEEEQINPQILYKYTKSTLWNKLKIAQEIHKEEPFYISKSAKEIYGIENNDDEIIIQGIIDLYYRNEEGKIVLVDYKTDYVEEGQEEKLIKKYKEQLYMYKDALEQSLQENVSEIILYSVYVQKEINIPII